MYRVIPALLVSLAGVCNAQTPSQFMIFPERNGSSATFTSRPTTAAVEVFTEVTGKLFAGVGDDSKGNNKNCRIRGLYHWATDENASTREDYFIVFRRPDSTGKPDTTAGGRIFRSPKLSLPTGNGRLGWRINVTFSTPVNVPCTGGFYMGVEMPASPNWPGGDGHSVWDARNNPPSSRPIGDNPRAGAPQHAWSNASGTVRNHPWIWRIGTFTDNAVLNVGGIDPANARQQPVGSSCYGTGGMYPDVGGTPRRDGIDIRIEDRARPTAMAYGFLAGALLKTGLNFTFTTGRLYLDPLSLSALGSTRLNGGIGVIRVAAPRSIPTTIKGDVFFQAATLDQNVIVMSNAQGTNF